MLVTARLVFPLFISSAMASCSMTNWGTSFDKKGYSKCSSEIQYMNGLERNDRGDNKIYRFEQVRCYAPTRPYNNQPTQCLAADWVISLDKYDSRPSVDSVRTHLRRKLGFGTLNGLDYIL